MIYIEMIISEMTCIVSSGALNSTNSPEMIIRSLCFSVYAVLWKRR